MAQAAQPAAPAVSLAALRAEVRALEGRPDSGGRLAFGIAEIDRRLPGGGLPLGALHEVEGGGADRAAGAAAVLFVAGILARRGGAVLWCVERCDLYAPALAAVGLDPARLIVAEAGGAVLAAMEEGLRHGGLAGVVGESGRLDLTASRRLSLAAEAAGTPAFVLRRRRFAAGGGTPRGRGEEPAAAPTAAATRWQVAPLPSGLPAVLARAGDGGRTGLARPLWHLFLTRCRNGEPGGFVVEACDDEGHLAPGPASVSLPAAAPLSAAGAGAPDRRAGPAAVGDRAPRPRGRVVAFPGAGRPGAGAGRL